MSPLCVRTLCVALIVLSLYVCRAVLRAAYTARHTRTHGLRERTVCGPYWFPRTGSIGSKARATHPILSEATQRSSTRSSAAYTLHARQRVSVGVAKCTSSPSSMPMHPPTCCRHGGGYSSDDADIDALNDLVKAFIDLDWDQIVDGAANETMEHIQVSKQWGPLVLCCHSPWLFGSILHLFTSHTCACVCFAGLMFPCLLCFPQTISVQHRCDSDGEITRMCTNILYIMATCVRNADYARKRTGANLEESWYGSARVFFFSSVACTLRAYKQCHTCCTWISHGRMALTPRHHALWNGRSRALLHHVLQAAVAG